MSISFDGGTDDAGTGAAEQKTLFDQILLDYIAQEWLLHGRFPITDTLLQRFKLTTDTYTKWLSTPRIVEYLVSVGIAVPNIRPAGELTTLQIAALTTIFDINDRRSDAKKLADLSIDTKTYTNWKKDPTFQTAIKKLADTHFETNIDEVMRSVLDQSRGGDLGASKVVLEMTGRLSRAGDVDVNRLITLFIESVSRHVADPIIMQKIAADLVMATGTVGLNKIPVGSDTHRALEQNTIQGTVVNNTV